MTLPRRVLPSRRSSGRRRRHSSSSDEPSNGQVSCAHREQRPRGGPHLRAPRRPPARHRTGRSGQSESSPPSRSSTDSVTGSGGLAGGAKDAPERHQNVRATIDWRRHAPVPAGAAFSCDFAVFNGGARLNSIEAVLITSEDVLELISALVDHNLVVRREDADGEPRFMMLQTIREYAVRRLDEDLGHRDELDRRHAEHVLDLMLTAKDEVGDADERLVEREQDNLRAAHLLARRTRARARSQPVQRPPAAGGSCRTRPVPRACERRGGLAGARPGGLCGPRAQGGSEGETAARRHARATTRARLRS